MLPRQAVTDPDAVEHDDNDAGKDQSGMVGGEIVRHRSLRADRGDGVLEHELIRTVDLDDDGKPIEILDAPLELASVEQVNADGEPVAAARSSGRHPGCSAAPRRIAVQ